MGELKVFICSMINDSIKHCFFLKKKFVDIGIVMNYNQECFARKI